MRQTLIKALYALMATLLLASASAQTVGRLQDECMTALTAQLMPYGLDIRGFRELVHNAPFADGRYFTCGVITLAEGQESQDVRFIYEHGQRGGVLEIWMEPENFARSWRLCTDKPARG